MDPLQHAAPVVKEIAKAIKYVYTQVKLANNVKAELNDLKQPLSLIVNWCNVLQKVNHPPSDLMEWCNDVMAARDEFDDYIYRVVREHHESSLLKFKTKFDLKTPVAKLKVKVNVLIHRFKESKYKILLLQVDQRVSPLALMYSEYGLVGCDDILSQLQTLLKTPTESEGSSRITVSIVGDAGSGKTAVAMHISKSMMHEFDFIAYLHAPVIMADTILSLWSQLNEGSPLGKDQASMINECKDALDSKRYLVVVDDVWQTEQWDSFLKLFPKNERGSRLIVTTRLDSVARTCSVLEDSIVQVFPLDYISSRTLFLTALYGVQEDPLQKFWQSMNTILDKCFGNPLCIICSAKHILANGRRKVEVWNDLANSTNWLGKSSDALVLLGQVLELSFTRLPQHLERPALMLGGFESNTSIDADILLAAWRAQNFVEPESGSSLAVAAYSYLCELVDRHIVDAEIDAAGRIKSVIVSALMHNVLQGTGLRRGFFSDSGQNFGQQLTRKRMTRLTFINQDVGPDVLDGSSLTATRVLMLLSCERYPILNKFRFLQVLIVLDCPLFDDREMEEITKLTFLKMVAVSAPKVTHLPKKLGHLEQLESLLLDNNNRMCPMPNSYTRLRMLTCLRVGDVFFTHGIAGLVHLEVLETFNVGASSVESVYGLGTLPKLRVLSCSWYLSNAQDPIHCCTFSTSIQNLLKQGTLEVLTLLGENFPFRSLNICAGGKKNVLKKFFLDSCFGFPQMPVGIGGLEHLLDLTITVDTLHQNGIDVLGGLKFLKRLQVWLRNEDVCSIEFYALDFPELTCLTVGGPVLSFSFGIGCLPSLEVLDITPLSVSLSGLRNVLGLQRLCCNILCKGAEGAEIMVAVKEAVAIHKGKPSVVFNIGRRIFHLD